VGGGASVPSLWKIRVTVTILALLLCMPGSSAAREPTVHDTTSVEGDAVQITLNSDTVEHPSITISNDSELASQGWPGNGSESNPFRIDNLNVTANGTCIKITNTRAYVVVSECILNRWASEDGSSIFLGNVTHCSITDCKIEGGSLDLDHSYGCSITRNNVSGSSEGIYFYTVSYSNVTENRIHECGTGIKCRLVASNLVTHNQVFNCGKGIHSDFENDDYPSYYLNNTISNCTKGLHIENGGLFKHNDIHGGHTSVYVEFGYLSVVANNSIDTFSHYGIYAEWAHNSTIANNTISAGSTAGIVLHFCQESIISSNLLIGCGLSLEEFHLSDSEDYWLNAIEGNLVNGKSLLYITDVSGALIEMADYGQLIAFRCSDLVLNGGFFENVCDAVLLAYCTSVQISSIMAVGGSPGVCNGVSLFESTRCTIEDSDFFQAGINIAGRVSDSWNHSVVNCYCNGKEIRLLHGTSGGALDADDFGQIILANCNDTEVRDGTIADGTTAVILGFCHNCQVVNVTALGQSDSGIRVSCSEDCIVELCHVSDCRYGLHPYMADHCHFRNCTVERNEVGVYYWGGLESRVYYNLIRQNELNARATSISSYWDDGSNLGNFWDGYDGIDFYEIYHDFSSGTGYYDIVDRFPNGTRHDWEAPLITVVPDDFEYVDDGVTMQILHWDVEDEHSGRYKVFLDGEVIRYGWWWPYEGDYGGPIVGIDPGLAPGTHNITILVEDLGAFFASATTYMTVLPSTTTTTTTTQTTTTETGSTTTTTSDTGTGSQTIGPQGNPTQILLLLTSAACAVVIIVFGGLSYRRLRERGGV
jgi:parallel beta-helix repeat protein